MFTVYFQLEVDRIYCICKLTGILQLGYLLQTSWITGLGIFIRLHAALKGMQCWHFDILKIEPENISGSNCATPNTINCQFSHHYFFMADSISPRLGEIKIAKININIREPSLFLWLTQWLPSRSALGQKVGLVTEKSFTFTSWFFLLLYFYSV